MNIKLNSDFADIYDDIFTADGEVTFDRQSKALIKREQLIMLKMMGHKIPRHDRVRNIYEGIAQGKTDAKFDSIFVMVFKDEHVTADGALTDTPNSVRLPLGKAYELYPDNFATIWMMSQFKGTAMYRMLRIGNRTYWNLHTSSSDWHSMEEDHTVVIPKVAIDDGDLDYITIPIYSIDFIQQPSTNRHDQFTAISLNLSPKLADFKFADEVTVDQIKQQVYDGIERAIKLA